MNNMKIKINKKKVSLISLSVVLVLLGVLFITSFPNSDNPIQNSISYNSQVCISKNNNLIECSSNVLTTAGANVIRDTLGEGTSFGAFDYVGLCNATAGCVAAAAGSTTLENEYALGGLERSQGSYVSNGNGNWSVGETFTATADNLLTNKTGIFNQSSGGTLLAENTFTLVTLQTNDQLTINWTIWVT